jgi:Tol biopolymer transport system component
VAGRRVFGCLAFAALIAAAAPSAAGASFPGANGGFAVGEWDSSQPQDVWMTVWVTPADGSAREQVAVGDSPTWSPDGSTLVFAASSANSPISTVPATGGATTTVAQRGSTPEYSPDGSEIVYANDKAIRIVDLDGTGDRKVLRARGEDGCCVYDPTYLPNGKRLVFGGEPTAEKPGLWSVRTDGGGLRRLTKHPDRRRVDTAPDVSPDGSTIVFQHRQSPKGLATMSSDGSDVQLIPDTFFLFYPTFLPTGDRIAAIQMEWSFTKQMCGTGVVTITPTGEDPQTVARPGCAHGLSWQPLP